MFTDALASERPRSRGLAVVPAALLLALWAHGPIAQWPDYHAFADTRTWLGIPNAANVLSNLPFAAVGAWGLWRLVGLRHAASGVRADGAWLLFCVAVFCTAAGSALYHASPDNLSLVTDRLPIAWACVALLCGFLAERFDERWGNAPSLAVALALATLSVAWWWWTDRQGTGDLRAYLFVQFLPMALVPIALFTHADSHQEDAVRNSTWWLVLGLYAAAKGLEVADHWVFVITHGASGHMLKHLFAAGAAGFLVAAIVRRDQLR